jgi:V-type H+-transporting ATPase subunit E
MLIQLQVGQELRKMTQFIRQEATEKAREIELKADEEFAIEKSKLVRQEQGAIDLTYEKKFKAAAMSQQITRSTVANKSRLKVLSAKQELLDSIFEATSKRLWEPSKDVHKYQEILKNLILEGFYALNESRVKIRARRVDYGIVNEAIEVACDELEHDVSIIIDEQNPLSEGW